MATNVQRIEEELRAAVEQVDEKYEGYREDLIQAAVQCIADQAEHAETQININQRFDARLRTLASNMVEGSQ